MNSRSKLQRSATPLEDKPSNTNKGVGLILETPYKPGFVDDTDLESVKMAVDKELSDISNALFITTERTADTIKRTDLLQIEGENIRAMIREVDFVSKENDIALAEKILTMEAEINDNVKASIEEERRVRASADGALAERIETIIAAGGDVNQDLYAKIKDETRARTDADTALTERIRVAESDFKAADLTLGNSVNARIATEETTRATADTALTTRIDSLTSTVSNNNTVTTARIAAEEKARADADSAMTTRVNSLESTLKTADTNLSASIKAEETARVNSISQEVNTLNGKISTTNTAITTQVNAAKSELSGNIASVQTSVNTNVQTINGRLSNIESKWAVTTDVNGNIAGIALINGGASKSVFSVRADTFRFVDASGHQSGGFTSGGGITTFNGHVNATSGSFTGHVNATSGSFTGYVNATSGNFTGNINAQSGTFNNGTFNNCTIAANCTINGTLSVDRITGGIAQLVGGPNFSLSGNRSRVMACVNGMFVEVSVIASTGTYNADIRILLDGVVKQTNRVSVRVEPNQSRTAQLSISPVWSGVSPGSHNITATVSGYGGQWSITNFSTGTWIAVVE